MPTWLASRPRSQDADMLEILALPFAACLVLLYAVIGAAHFAARKPMLSLSLDPAGATRASAAWDLFFYATFALVVTSSVRVAGVLLVFAYLVVPAAIGALLARGVRGRLL